MRYARDFDTDISQVHDFNNWREEYQRKLVTPDKAAKLIKSGDRVVMPCAFRGLTPLALIARRQELKDVSIQSTAPISDPGWYLTDMGDSFKLTPATYLGPSARIAHDEKRADFLPYTNLTWWKAYREGRTDSRNIDVLITKVSPPDENGFCSFGDNLWESKNYARVAKTVIGEVDGNAIRTYGDNFIHVSQIDYFVEATEPLPTPEELETLINAFPEGRREEVRRKSPGFNPVIVKSATSIVGQTTLDQIERALGIDQPSEAVEAITTNLKTVLRDRDTIMIGTGRPSQYMVELGVFDHLSDLSIYSEMACPGLGKLVKRGIATGRYATLHPGKAVFTGLLGMRWDEIQFANDNPMFELYSSSYVLNIPNIAANDNMVSINNALQVDLTGQITCETQFGPRMINGPGGQTEFHIGAFLSRGGRAVTLLCSTALQGCLSTIVPQLAQGSIVDIPRVYADIIITEHGVARLSTKTHRERAEALINIAHPDFRNELRKEAQRLFGL